MFRLVIAAITALILLSSALNARTPEAFADVCDEPFIQGDWNGDHTITVGDAQSLARRLVHLPAYPPCISDVDCDGEVTIGDAVKIARYLAGLPHTQREPCPDIGTAIAPFAGVEVEVRTDKTSYAEGELVRVTVTATNATHEAVDLAYSDCQRFDVRIADGDLDVWRWSHDKGFCQEPAVIPLAAGESRTFEATWSQLDNSGNPVPRGSYAVFGISSHCRVFPNDCGLSSSGIMITLT